MSVSSMPYEDDWGWFSNVVFLLPTNVTPPDGVAGAYAACSCLDNSHQIAQNMSKTRFLGNSECVVAGDEFW